MKRIFSILILLALPFVNSRCSMKKDISTDLSELCELANQISKDTNSSKSKLVVQFMTESNKLELSDETRKFLNDLSVQSDVSYGDFTDFAARNEVNDFQCPSIKNLFEK
ncbi:hypothetical protein [Sporocytophaga myxococcoides]|uniref:hypothetical protein n=1 Tax=Sporocytophaga myxococcoides TaxID=153721 RepID=UPI00048A4AF9|nr:hypothetical protein [Sporocytophaga myxococcoides]